MTGKNKVFIACSLDGKIADKKNSIEWLNIIPNPKKDDAGYAAFMKNIDAIVMGRNTFEIVDSFGIDWPYKVPVFVLSNSIKEIPPKYVGKVETVSGELKDIVNKLNNKGFKNLYIDGGKTIHHFLEEDLIDEITITTIPIILGGGVPLFSDLTKELLFKHQETKVFLDEMVQSYYVRKRVK